MEDKSKFDNHLDDLFIDMTFEYLIPLGRGEYLLVCEAINIVGPCDSLFPVDIGIKARFVLGNITPEIIEKALKEGRKESELHRRNESCQVSPSIRYKR